MQHTATNLVAKFAKNLRLVVLIDFHNMGVVRITTAFVCFFACIFL